MQDGKASIPQWLEHYILRRHGAWMLRRLHIIGAIHDDDLTRDRADYREHNRAMIDRMREASIAPEVICIIHIGLKLYWSLPAPITRLYWRFIK